MSDNTVKRLGIYEVSIERTLYVLANSEREAEDVALDNEREDVEVPTAHAVRRIKPPSNEDDADSLPWCGAIDRSVLNDRESFSVAEWIAWCRTQRDAGEEG